MSWKQTVVWLFLRNTTIGRNILGTADAELRGLIAVAARRAYQDNRASRAQAGRSTQYQDGDLIVKVKNGYNRDHDCYVTDIIIEPQHDNPRHSHQHVVIAEDGTEIMNEWRPK